MRRAPLYWVMILIDAMLTLPPLFGFQAACDAARTHFFGEDAVLPWEH